MTVPAFHVEAKLHAFRKTQDGVVVSFVLHPQEVPPALALDPLGTRYVLALCAIGDDEQPIPPRGGPEPESADPPTSQATPAASDVGGAGGRTAGSTPATGAIQRQRYAASSPAEQAVTRAAILCGDPRFRVWLTGEEASETTAIRVLREACGVQSRAEIAVYPDAHDKFLKIETEFKMDVGELPRPR